MGRISIVNFREPQNLKKDGNNIYLYEGDDTDISGMENPNMVQGYLERSNVNVTEEMIKMVETFRAFESVQKAIQSIDEMTSKMVNDPALFQ